MTTCSMVDVLARTIAAYIHGQFVKVEESDPDFVNLKSILSSPIITISSSASVKQAIDLMRINKIKRLPVTTDKIDDNNNMIMGRFEIIPIVYSLIF